MRPILSVGDRRWFRSLVAAMTLVVSCGGIAVAVERRPTHHEDAVSASGGPPSTSTTLAAAGAGNETAALTTTSTTSTESVTVTTPASEPQSATPTRLGPESSESVPAPEPTPPAVTSGAPITDTGLWVLDGHGGAAQFGSEPPYVWRVVDDGVLSAAGSSFTLRRWDGSERSIPVPPCGPDVPGCEYSTDARSIFFWDAAGDRVAFSWSAPYGTAFGTSVAHLDLSDERSLSDSENHPNVAVAADGAVATLGFDGLRLAPPGGALSDPIPVTRPDPDGGPRFIGDGQRLVWRAGSSVYVADRAGQVRLAGTIASGPARDVIVGNDGSAAAARWIGGPPPDGTIGNADLGPGQTPAGAATGHFTKVRLSPSGDTLAAARSITLESRVLELFDATGTLTHPLIDDLYVSELGWSLPGDQLVVSIGRYS